jgi:hypothetical protein
MFENIFNIVNVYCVISVLHVDLFRKLKIQRHHNVARPVTTLSLGSKMYEYCYCNYGDIFVM